MASHAILTRSGKEYSEAQPAKSDVVISSEADTENPEQPVERREEKKIEKAMSLLKEYQPRIPYPARLKKDQMDAQFGKFLNIFKQLTYLLLKICCRCPNI